jgi:hypothetical protein
MKLFAHELAATIRNHHGADLAVPFQHPHDGSFVLTASFGNAATVLVAVQLQVILRDSRAQFTSTAVVMIKQLFGARQRCY